MILYQNDEKEKVRRSKGISHGVKCITLSVKHGEGGVMARARMAARGTGSHSGKFCKKDGWHLHLHSADE